MRFMTPDNLMLLLFLQRRREAMGKKRIRADRVIRYPWDHWFALKRPFTLRKWVNFSCQTHSMAVQVRNAAKTRKKKVSIKTVGEDLHVTVTKKPRRRK